jgi:hypothetical protein
MLERRQVIDDSTGEIIIEKEQRIEQNKNFVQLYRGELHTVAKLGTADPLALAIWLWIVERMGRDNALVCSMEPLVEHFGKSRQTISKKISFLRKHRYLAIAKTGTTNVYLINAEIAWSASASRRRTAEFRSGVVLTESEQASPLDGQKPEPDCTVRSRRIVDIQQ